MSNPAPKNTLPKNAIDVYLRPQDAVYAKFYPNEDIHLCDELAGYLTSHAIDKNLKQALAIHLYCGSGHRPEQFQAALENTFYDKVYDVNKSIRRKNIVAVVSFVLGALFGLGAFFIGEGSILFASLLAIIAWVFIWYAVESYSFDNSQLSLERFRYKKILEAEIFFHLLPPEEQ